MIKRICSWDVGIKNLAYCVIEQKDNKCSIIRWDIVNLIEDMKSVCKEHLNNGKICGKNATFSGNINGNNINYCGTHKKNYKPLEDGWEDTMFIPAKGFNDGCSYILPKKQSKCGKKINCHNNTDQSYYCTIHKNLLINQMKKNNSLKKIKKIKCNALDIQILGENMYKKLDKIKELTTVTDVYIENQPSLKNPTMKTVSSLLFGYFVARGIIDKDKTKSDIKLIKFISPSNKIKVDSDKVNKLLGLINKDGKVFKTVEIIVDSLINDKIFSIDLSQISKEKLVYFIIEYLINKKEVLKSLKSYDWLKLLKLKILNIKLLNLQKETKTKKSDIEIFLKAIEKHQKNYIITKTLAIDYTKFLLKDDEENVNKLNNYKKKDDLCDAFLQGYYLLNR
jgi:hypothetical protein